MAVMVEAVSYAARAVLQSLTSICNPMIGTHPCTDGTKGKATSHSFALSCGGSSRPGLRGNQSVYHATCVTQALQSCPMVAMKLRRVYFSDAGYNGLIRCSVRASLAGSNGVLGAGHVAPLEPPNFCSLHLLRP